jgi:ribonuclease Z
VDKVTRGLNLAYELDRGYRTGHHGADLMPLELGELIYQEIETGVVLEDRGLTITAFTVEHDPIKPALGYRIDYKGRSVVISGDSIATESTFDVATNADLLFHDALSKEALAAVIEVSREAGRDRLAQIFTDVMDYHADAKKLEMMSAEAGVKQLVLYHLVPTPVNGLLMRIWQRGLQSSTLIANDGMTFELPAGEGAVVVTP